jgi:hypothetical protein
MLNRLKMSQNLVNLTTENEKQTEKSSFSDFKVEQLTNSLYINPFRIKFNQNNCERIWDGVNFKN